MPHYQPIHGKPIALAIAVGLQLLCVGCDRAEPLTGAQSLDGAACAFDICWPPRDPEEPAPASTQPLLRGNLALTAQPAAKGGTEVWLVVTVTRPSEETDRQFWNSELAYADLAWMDAVRVWDKDGQWLWPNLPYLLRLPGRQRIERYGGTDPNKHVDNDFAAVLIRKYDARGDVESSETKDSPLVSAEWHADGLTNSGLYTVAHVARSDTFLLHLGGDDGPARGQFKMWLIYADFLGSRPPRTWPAEREWAGGILAYFEVDWETLPDGGCRGAVRHQRPKEGTRFDWAKWVGPSSHQSQAAFRLSDIAD